MRRKKPRTWGGAREGAGRPPSEEKLKKVTVRLAEWQIEAIDAASVAVKMKRDEFLRRLISDQLNRALQS